MAFWGTFHRHFSAIFIVTFVVTFMLTFVVTLISLTFSFPIKRLCSLSRPDFLRLFRGRNLPPRVGHLATHPLPD